MSTVVTLGEVMGRMLAEPGVPLTQATRFDRSVAGSEGNVAVGLARLGHPVSFLGRVGADPPGRWVTTTLRGEGVDVTGVRVDASRPTGLLLRDRPAGQPVTVLYYRAGSAGSALEPADVDAARIGAARLLFVTALTTVLSDTAHAAVGAAVEAARTAGVPVVFDPNPRLRLADVATWRRAVRWLAPYADTVLVGADELDLLGLTERWLLACGPRTVVVKDGAQGARAWHEGRWTREPARPVPVVDPVGAGDAFAAGWISATLRGEPVAERLRHGCAVASFVVATPGDLTGLPDRATLDRALSEPTVDVLR